MSDPATMVELDRLRVGMYVHLDLGWTDHPFPFSSFKIKSADQIATIRSLGLREVRWSPDKSDAAPAPDLVASSVPPPVSVAASAPPPVVDARSIALRARRELLARQQASLARVEQRFGEASRHFKQLLQNARGQPEATATATDALAQAMLGEVGGEREVAIRLLSERAGEETSQHALNVCVLALLLGRACGLGPAALRDLAIGSLLHDIGKLELPGRLRWGGDQLTAAERRISQQHVEHGVQLARRMGLPTGAITVIAEHHERADGSGYPAQLRGVQLSPASRIVTLVNHYDNLCNPGNALQALTPHEALATIFSRQRAQFDGPTLALFVRMMGVYPPGSVVQLSDGRYALSVAVNPLQPTKPKVVVHDSRIPVEQAIVLDLETEPGLDITAAIKPAMLPRNVFEYLSPRKRTAYFFESADAG